MIVVDTNVWSETLQPDPDPAVLAWMHAMHASIYMPVVARHELRTGVALLPSGRRRDALADLVDGLLQQLAPRILPYDSAAADAHSVLRARAQKDGRALSSEDGQILGIAAAHGASVATRNVRDFVDHGVEIIDPWRFRAT